ncbi:LytR/AlgR family response regulator transcription factor [Anaerocolumna aminovalerica]|uniref:LytR/AlgR family response regulator transcription factor n=1 Tax=Anaerocolumna aminovalerica TaxID=1527 RepID=UPI00248D0953|nr:LytTR family DNA-binding domain-containing protein [Anaerocolumna aminovalerica]
MIDIIITEDNLDYQNFLQKYIISCINDIKLDARINLITDNPNKVIKYASEHNTDTTKVYFLDIKYDKYKTNGIIVGKEIRKHDPFGYLIYITVHLQYAADIFQYKLEALDYIYKEDADIKERITQCLDVVKEEENKKTVAPVQERILIKAGANYYNVRIEDIIYIESSLHRKIRVHTQNQSIEYYNTLSNIEQSLTDAFFKTHRSYIVNTKFIKVIDAKKGVVIMKNNAKCLIAKSLIKDLENMLKT